MLRPQLSIRQLPDAFHTLRLSDQTGGYDALANPGGFSGPNATRAQVMGTLTIRRAQDSQLILAETPLPTDFFVTAAPFDYSLTLSDALLVVTTNLYSAYGLPVLLTSYALPSMNYPADARLTVQRGSAWVDVTAEAIINQGQISWTVFSTADTYSGWRLSTPSGALTASGTLTTIGTMPSPTATMMGNQVGLVGTTTQRFLADGGLRTKIAYAATRLSTEPDYAPSAAPRLGAWGKLYFDYQALLLAQSSQTPGFIDAKLAHLHRMADRL